MIASKRYLIILTLLLLTLRGCNSLKVGLTLKKKANTDEFLVKKKEPLTLPPNFNELPEPTESIKKTDEEIDFTKILKEKDKTIKKIKKNPGKENSLEKSIIKIINVN